MWINCYWKIRPIPPSSYINFFISELTLCLWTLLREKNVIVNFVCIKFIEDNLLSHNDVYFERILASDMKIILSSLMLLIGCTFADKQSVFTVRLIGCSLPDGQLWGITANNMGDCFTLCHNTTSCSSVSYNMLSSECLGYKECQEFCSGTVGVAGWTHY